MCAVGSVEPDGVWKYTHRLAFMVIPNNNMEAYRRVSGCFIAFPRFRMCRRVMTLRMFGMWRHSCYHKESATREVLGAFGMKWERAKGFIRPLSGGR